MDVGHLIAGPWSTKLICREKQNSQQSGSKPGSQACRLGSGRLVPLREPPGKVGLHCQAQATAQCLMMAASTQAFSHPAQPPSSSLNPIFAESTKLNIWWSRVFSFASWSSYLQMTKLLWASVSSSTNDNGNPGHRVWGLNEILHIMSSAPRTCGFIVWDSYCYLFLSSPGFLLSSLVSQLYFFLPAYVISRQISSSNIFSFYTLFLSPVDPECDLL